MVLPLFWQLVVLKFSVDLNHQLLNSVVPELRLKTKRSGVAGHRFISETRKDRPAGVNHRRSWHTDWPHDLSSYGPSDKEPWRHCGAVSQPFPDVCMALSTVWCKNEGPHIRPERVSPSVPSSLAPAVF